MIDWIMMGLILALVGGFAFLQVRALRGTETTGQRVVAALPSLALIIAVLIIVIGIANDPTSHNLWPFELLLWIGGGIAYLLVLKLARKLAGPHRA